MVLKLKYYNDDFVKRLQFLSKEEQMEKEFYRNTSSNNGDFFKLLSHLAPVGIFFINTEDKCTYVNQKWIDISGVEFNEAFGKKWIDFVHPEDREKVEHKWHETVRGNRTFKLDFRFWNLSGETTWVLGQIETILDKSGHMIGHVGTVNEISERMRAWEEARENEERFSNAFEFSAIGMALVSLEGKWLKVNNSFCNILGYSKLEMMGLTFQDITYHDDLNTDLANVKRMLAGEINTYVMEKRYFHKTGKIIWVRLSTSLVRNKNHAPLYFISQIEDITDRKWMEEKLLENEKRLELAASSARIGVWEADLDRHLLRWNDQMYKLYGRKKDSPETDLHSWMDFIHADDRDRVREEYKKSLDGEKFFNAEFRVVWPDKTIKVIRGMSIVIRENGRPTRVTGVNLDVTEDKKTIERLRELNTSLDNARKSAEDATKMKSRFLDIAAHELRTPVTALSLLLELTQRKFEKNISVDGLTLSRLRLQCDRISRLVIDLLDVSRLERGILTMNFELKDINSLIVECVSDIKLHSPSRTINFRKPEFPIKVEIDSIRIYQVISNLLNNAIKYTPEEKPIDVEVVKRRDSIQVSVIDHGRGIPEDQQAGLFTIFSRGSTELTERSGGLGLGLFISKSIVELHGGKIHLHSKLGEGSTFSFELPLNGRHYDQK